MKSKRKLAFKDVFSVAKIIRNANIREQLTDIATRVENSNVKNAKNENMQEQVGIEIFIMLFEHIAENNVKTAAEELLADISGTTIDEIDNAPIDEIVELFVDILNKNDIKNFFQNAARLPIQQ